MMYKLLCSSGALITRQNNRNYMLLEDAGKNIPCDGFEFMMYSTNWYEFWEKIATEVAAMKLPVYAFHADKRIGELISRKEEGDTELAYHNFRINCEMAKMLGAPKLVLHLWGGISSDRCIANNIEAYRQLRQVAEEYGLLLTVENVPCNQQNPLLHWKELHDVYPDIAFTFDMRFAAFHGQLEEYFSEENAWLWQGAVQHIHVSDFDGAPMEWGRLGACLHPGEGYIDYEKLFENLKRVGYRGTFTVESTSTNPDGSFRMERIEETFAYLRRLCSKL